MKKFYDVVISGAGISGVTLAALLKKSVYFKQKSVLVLDKSIPQIRSSLSKTKSSAQNGGSVPFSNRVYAVSPANVDTLKQCGAWEVICDDYRQWPAYRMQTLDARSRSGFTTFQNQLSNEPIAHFLESDVIVSSLLKCIESNLTSTHKVVTIEKNEITNLSSQVGSVELTLKDGQQIDTTLLIGAEGFKSNVRNLAGMKWYGYDYAHHALVGNLGVECPEGNRTAWQRFMPFGPIASLPLSKDTASLVLFADKTYLDLLKKKPESEIVEELNRFWTEDYTTGGADSVTRSFNSAIVAFSSLLESFTTGKSSDSNTSGSNLFERGVEPKPPVIKSVEKSTLATFPVGFGHAVKYVKPNIALIGDAAHRIHPLAGQGANLGLFDCSVLFDQVESSIKRGDNPGNLKCLLEYERIAQSHNVPTQLFCDVIYRLYRQDALPFVLLRSAAATGVNNFHSLASSFVNWASYNSAMMSSTTKDDKRS